MGIIMKPVIQLERTGCGIASVSAVVGLSYPKTKSIANSLGIFAHDESLWSETAHVRSDTDNLDQVSRVYLENVTESDKLSAEGIVAEWTWQKG